MSWFRYHANILWPNFEVIEEAPATAKWGELKKVLAADRMSGCEDIERVCGMMLLGKWEESRRRRSRLLRLAVEGSPTGIVETLLRS
jgi:hypothetical protein